MNWPKDFVFIGRVSTRLKKNKSLHGNSKYRNVTNKAVNMKVLFFDSKLFFRNFPNSTKVIDIFVFFVDNPRFVDPFLIRCALQWQFQYFIDKGVFEWIKIKHWWNHNDRNLQGLSKHSTGDSYYARSSSTYQSGSKYLPFHTIISSSILEQATLPLHLKSG